MPFNFQNTCMYPFIANTARDVKWKGLDLETPGTFPGVRVARPSSCSKCLL